MTYRGPNPDAMRAAGIDIHCNGASYAEHLDDLTLEAVRNLNDLDRLPRVERRLAEELAEAADPDLQVIAAVQPLIAQRRPRSEILAAAYRVALSFRSRCDCEMATPEHVERLVRAVVAEALGRGRS